MSNKFTFKKAIKHLKLILMHKHYVFLASLEAGIPFRGLLHDMSKFNPKEFLNSVKYYNGKRSPIDVEKEIKGYSYAWLHHRGHNPHHWEYWIDNLSSGGVALKIPKKYVIEMLCDWIGAGKAYDFDNWGYDTPFKRFVNLYNSGHIKIHIDTYILIFNILQEYSKGKKSLKTIIKECSKNY